MKKSLMLGAMALVASAAATAASAHEYGFYTASGSPYCDGVMYSGYSESAGTPATGYHVYDQTNCPYTNAVLGGFKGHVRALGPDKYFTFPVSNAASSGEEYIVFTFYINPQNLVWSLYYESTDYNIAFTYLNSGMLVQGPPYAMVKPGQKRLGSVIRESMAALKK